MALVRSSNCSNWRWLQSNIRHRFYLWTVCPRERNLFIYQMNHFINLTINESSYSNSNWFYHEPSNVCLASRFQIVVIPPQKGGWTKKLKPKPPAAPPKNLSAELRSNNTLWCQCTFAKNGFQFICVQFHFHRRWLAAPPHCIHQNATMCRARVAGRLHTLR